MHSRASRRPGHSMSTSKGTATIRESVRMFGSVSIGWRASYPLAPILWSADRRLR